MSIAQSEFWSRLIQSGLADTAGCQKHSVAFKNRSGGSSDADAAGVAEFLVQGGNLTAFQASRLLSQGDPGLRVGSFVATSDQPVRPFTHWLPVQTPVGSGLPPARYGFLLRVPLASLDETCRAWLAIHSEINVETLQPVELSGGAQAGDAEQTVEIFSPMPEGISLWTALQRNAKLSPRKVVRIGMDLARALGALHTSSPDGGQLAHGAVGADHVWITSKAHAVLLRDPSSPPRSPLADQSGSWIERIEPPAQNAAPELAEAGAVPTPKSDIYSLGCLLFSLFVGRPPFIGGDATQLFAFHRHDVPPEITEAVELGAEGNPILRVIAFAMAKDPAARFETAEALADALEKAGELYGDQVSAKARHAAEKSEPTPTPQPDADSPVKESPVTKSPVAEAPVIVAAAKADVPQAERPKLQAKPGKEPKASSRSKTSGRSAAPASDKPRKKNPVSESPRPAVETPPSPPTIAPPVAETFSSDNEAPPPAAVAVAPSIRIETSPESKPPVGQQESLAEKSSPDASPVPTTSVSQKDVDDHAESTTRSRRRRKRKKNRVPILAGTMVLPLLLLGLAIFLRGRGPVRPDPPPRPTPGIVRNVPKVPDSRREVVPPAGPQRVNGFEIVDSDRLLWVPPYAADSQPPSLELLPPGPAAIVSVLVADVTADESASPILNAFEPEFDALLAAATQRSGVDRESIRRCTAALFPGTGGWPEVALSIELTEPMDLKQLTEKWNVAESRLGEMTIYAGEDSDSDAFFIGDGNNGKLAQGDQVRRFAVGSLERIREVAEMGGGSIPLASSLQTLWDSTSENSGFVALVTPNFLFADGRQMLASTVPQLQRPARSALIPDVAALSLSVAVDEGRLYLEVRQLPSGSTTAPALLQAVRDRIGSWPEWADNFIVNSVPDTSWRLLATRLPLMLRFVGSQTRSSIVDQAVVTTTYLPIDAGSQVALGTFLALNTAPGGVSIASSETSTEPLTVEEMLNRPMSISFLQLSLQFAVDAVVEEFTESLPEGSTMPKVRIIGGDLEKNGITQNQQIRGFEITDRPLRGVLTDLVLGANPDKTATGPKDPKQALIWVVHPVGKSPEESEILITTRDAAKGKYELPPDFRPEDEE